MIFEVKEKFKLSDKFLENYKGRQPEWGPVGYLTYKRSYARNLESENRTEEFWETLKRVVEGCYTIQLNHCKHLKLPWNAYKSQKSAQEMYRLMWEFKFLPPGRSLWAGGTDVVWKKGSAALLNCFSGGTKFYFKDEEGVIHLEPLEDLVGETVNVLNRNGEWVPAEVKCYGKQKLADVIFKYRGRSEFQFDYLVTENHRWLLSNDEFTTELKVGDKIKSRFIIPKVDKESFIDEEYTMGREYASRYFGSLFQYKKDSGCIPVDPELDGCTMEFYEGFLDGWIALESYNYEYKNGSILLKTRSVNLATWLEEISPLLGYSVTGTKIVKKKYKKEQVSRYMYNITIVPKEVEYIVSNILDVEEEQDVYCVEEPITNTFTIEGGIVTGNCAFTSTKDINYNFSEPFEWMMDMSMFGVGVAYDTLGAGKATIYEPRIGANIHVVDDSKEGWCEAVRVVLDAYVGNGKLPMEFDFSKIRPSGSIIRTFGGIAPGPQPLINCIEEIKSVLNKRIDQVITSVDIVDLMNIIGKCVVSGGIRRVAGLALGSPSDKEYMNMKNPDLFPEEMKNWRWASNNSVFIEKGMDYKELAELVKNNGEPGFVNLDLIRKYGRIKDGINNKDEKALGVNPCGEQALEDREMCCLVEVFPTKHDNKNDFIHTLKYAYLYAKTVTLVPSHCERTNQVMLRNRRIGLSLCGIVDAFEKFGRRIFIDWMDEGYNRINVLDKKYSDWLCVPESIKKTTEKPSGSVSLLAGVSPGIHYPHSEYYIRRIRIQNGSPLIKRLVKAGIPNEPTVYNDNTIVFSFPIKSENFKKCKKDVTIWEQVENAVIMQYYWSDNCISQTVTVKPEELDQISDVLEMFEDRLKTISFLPLKKHGYEQAPYEEITKEQYEEMIKTIKTINLSGIPIKEEDSTRDKFCTGETCELSFPIKKDE